MALFATEGLIVLILHIDFKEIELVVCTPVNGDWPIIAYFYINTIRPTEMTKKIILHSTWQTL